jgi:hypothetical protein
MILVQSRLQPLNGNRLLKVLFFLGILSFMGGCIPRSAVVKSTTGSEGETVVPEVVVDVQEEVQEIEEFVPKIALLLPFQLNRSTGTNPTDADLKRAELALDFFQGFEMGLKRIAGLGLSIDLEVLDTRDSEVEARALAQSLSRKHVDLVVGPVFPKSIKAFESTFSFHEGKVLQVSPLAATMPTEFNQPNLVSITSPIMTHVRALAHELVKQTSGSDVIVLYHSEEASSQQYLPALKGELNLLETKATIIDVYNSDELKERLHHTGKNVVVSGSSNRFKIVSILNELSEVVNDGGYQVHLYGHPTWAKLSLGNEELLQTFKTTITSSYSIDAGDEEIRRFRNEYKAKFRVEPSEFAYKGYDIAYFFGELFERYGRDYRKHLVDHPFRGLHNDFEFDYNKEWGYVNSAIHFLTYKSGSFMRRP